MAGQTSYYYGFNATLNYKEFDLGLFGQGVGDVNIYNQTRQTLEAMTGGNNQSVVLLNRGIIEVKKGQGYYVAHSNIKQELKVALLMYAMDTFLGTIVQQF